MNLKTVPVIDIAALVEKRGDLESPAQKLREACTESGFFYIEGHGVPESLFARLEALSRTFFALPTEQKRRIRMELGSRAWRGYFGVGDELTSGEPDQKEGIYFGSELSSDHPDVVEGTPLHGQNLFPEIDGFRETVLEYLDRLTEVGHALMRGLALSLGLEAEYFYDRYTTDPLILFRIFNYPAGGDPSRWGVGEHTDYGILTILKQDETGGLEVKTKSGWISAPPIDGTFVCNIGDMLDRMTGGVYLSTPHRVRNTSGRDRLSYPFFFDPSFHVSVEPIDGVPEGRRHSTPRWDREDVHAFEGTYGDYVLKKVAQVFPQLRDEL